MGLIELIIIVLLILWVLGYFGRGRFYGGSSVGTGGSSGNWIHLILVLVVVLIVLRLLGIVV